MLLKVRLKRLAELLRQHSIFPVYFRCVMLPVAARRLPHVFTEEVLKIDNSTK